MIAVAVAASLVVAACGDSGGGDGETSVGDPATQDADAKGGANGAGATDGAATDDGTTDSSESSPGPAASKITLGEPGADGSVPVDVALDALSPLFFGFVETDPADPYFHIHTEDPELFLGIELFTKFGNGWTGQTGTFTTDCNANGICVYLDPDGKGDLAAAGPASAGTIAIAELNGGYDVTVSDLVLSTEAGDATYTLAGPLTLTG